MVTRLDATLPNGLLQRQRDGSAGRVAVLVDVDRYALDRQADAASGGIDDAEVGLVRHPEVDLVETDPRLRADLVLLADEDVDRELEDVGADHVDVRVRVLVRV